ncbi:MAG: hypothetical protein U0237_01930 [Thermoleophilia bacterium]
MPRNRALLLPPLMAAAALAWSGCSGGDTARMVTVERTVTVTADGRPFTPGNPDDGIADPVEPVTAAPVTETPPANGDDGVPDPDAGPAPWEPGGMARLLGDLRARFGGTLPQFTSIGIYDGYAVFYVRDPDKPGNVDRYLWRDGRLFDPQPVQIRRESVGPAAFRAREVNLARVPALVARARRIPIESPDVCCVLVSRQVPFSRAIQMTVSVSGPRESATLLADATGTIRRITR